MNRVEEPDEWPKIWLAWGLVVGVSAAIAALYRFGVLAGVLGGLTGVIAIVLTYVIADRQAMESGRLGETVAKIDNAVSDLADANTQLYDLALKIYERDSAQDYGASNEGPAEEDSPSSEAVPAYADEALEMLRQRGSTLSQGKVDWRKKTPEPPMPGNHGWFVESEAKDSAERWYVRKGRGWTIRKAMPRRLLEALEEQGVDPTQIKLDFQMKEHGLAAWYARTYSGDLWKVWESNRNRGLGVQAERVADNV